MIFGKNRTSIAQGRKMGFELPLQTLGRKHCVSSLENYEKFAIGAQTRRCVYSSCENINLKRRKKERCFVTNERGRKSHVRHAFFGLPYLSTAPRTTCHSSTLRLDQPSMQFSKNRTETEIQIPNLTKSVIRSKDT